VDERIVVRVPRVDHPFYVEDWSGGIEPRTLLGGFAAHERIIAVNWQSAIDLTDATIVELAADADGLIAAAQAVAAQGGFPRTAAGLGALPGVGRSTAAAIAVFAFGRRAAILDGNVKRVLARRFGVQGEKAQWDLAEKLLPQRGVRAYTQALMDLGATVCTRARPACGRCPVARACVARREGRIAELPAARVRKPLPVKSANWYVYLRAGEVLLERRPGAGLWGGLWTFPEARLPASPRGRKLPALEHGFTHFRLRAQPWLCPVRGATPPAAGRLWLNLSDATGAAVPAPVRTVLRSLLAGRTD
jgi:A/G-specific adenine glycosylase